MRPDLRALYVFSVPLAFALLLIFWPVPLGRLIPGAEAGKITAVAENGLRQERALLREADRSELNALLSGLRCVRTFRKDGGMPGGPGDLLIACGGDCIVLSETGGWVYRPADPAFFYRITGPSEILYARISSLLGPVP